MAVQFVPLLVGGAIVGYVATQPLAAVPKTNVGKRGGILVGTGGAPGQTLATVMQTGGKTAVGGPPPVPKRATVGTVGYRTSSMLRPNYGLRGAPVPEGSATAGGGNWITQAKATTQQTLDTINTYGKAAYDKLDSDAKQAGASALNSALNLDPPLKGDEDWQTVAKIAGGAAGAAAAGAACAPIGLAAVCGPLGAMCGSYLGMKIENFLNGPADDAKKWFQSKWGDIENWVGGVASDIGNDAQAAYDDTKNYIGGLF